MLKDKLNYIKDKLFCRPKGVFENSFIGNYIDNRREEDDFMAVYYTRVMSLVMASFLGLKMYIEENAVVMEGDGGEFAVETFYMGNPNETEEERVESATKDLACLAYLDKFIPEITSMQSKEIIFPCDTFDEAVIKIIGTIKINAYESEFFRGLSEEILNESEKQFAVLRSHVNGQEAKAVISSAGAMTKYLEKSILNREKNFPSPKQLRLKLQAILKDEYLRSKFDENPARQPYETQITNVFKNLRQIKNIQETPEMW